MATHPSTLAWKIPWTEDPVRLPSIGSLWVEHNWATSLSLFTFLHWRRKWQPTPVFLPGESQGQGSPVGCRLWVHIESDTTEVTWQQQQHYMHNQHLFSSVHKMFLPNPLSWVSWYTLTKNAFCYFPLITHGFTFHSFSTFLPLPWNLPLYISS